jgi:hypothetical protein
MAKFEVFIPGREQGMPNVTLTIEAPNWIGALRSGLKSIGEGQEAIANVMCDIKEDNSIHVTDVATARVFRLREVTAPPPAIESPKTMPDATPSGPRPISMPDGEPTMKNEREPDFSSSPRTLIEFPAMPAQPRAPAPALAPAPTRAPAPAPENPATIQMQATMPPPSAVAPTTAPAAPMPLPPPPVVVAKPTPAPTPPPARPTPAPLPPLAPPPSPIVSKPITQPAPQPKIDVKVDVKVDVTNDEPDTLKLQKEETERVERAVRSIPDPRPTTSPVSPPTPRGVPAPAPKRPSGQFSAAPQPTSREVTKPAPTDPKIGRVEKQKPAISVQDAVAAVFDATQDLYMNPALSPQKVADTLLDIALKHIPAESGTFYLADVNAHELAFTAVRGPKADALKRAGVTVKMGQGIIGFCAQEGVCLVVNDIQKDPRFYAAIARSIDYQPKDTVCASAEKDGRLFGAIQLINSQGGFDAAHMEVLRFIGLTAAAMLERIAENG